MESEETFDGFGLNPRTAEYFTVTNRKDFYKVPDSFTGFNVVFATTKINNTRSIYNFLDFLGDVGGLFDMLCIVATVLLLVSTFIFGSGLSQYLLSNIFKVDNSVTGENTLTSIRQRQPLQVRAI